MFWSSYRFRSILVILYILRGYFSCFRGLGLFWSFYRFQVFLVILEVCSYFWSFQRFWVYFGQFKGLGVFWSFYRFEGIQSFSRFRVYFYHLIGFRGIFVILQVSGGYFGHFQGYFSNFISMGHLSNFQVLGGISVKFQVSRVFQSFFRFMGYFGHFSGF